MKNVLKFFGIIALTAVIGFAVSCGDGGDDGNGNGANVFLGAWVYEDWIKGDGMAIIFKNDGTVVFNGGFASGTYNHNTVPATITIMNQTANMEINSSLLTITGIENAGGPFQKGGLLTLKDAPTTQYRFYISATPWTATITQDLMTGSATETIKAFVGRTPCGNDIAGGTTNPIFWSGTNSGTYHVLIREGGQNTGTWKYKNDVIFVNGENTTTFGFSEMTPATYSGS